MSEKDEVDYFQAVQLIALNNVLKWKDNKTIPSDYHIRRIFYYYSKKFNTPLAEVYDLPLHEVLLTYFENVFEEMEDGEIAEYRDEIIKSSDELKKDQESKDKSDITLLDDIRALTEEAAAVAQKIEQMTKGKKLEPTLNLPDIKLEFDELGKIKSKNPNDSIGLFDLP